MIANMHFRKALLISFMLHFTIAFLLILEPNVKNPVLVKDTLNVAGDIQPVDLNKVEPVKAVSVDSKELKAAVNQLKMQKEKERQAEVNRQAALNKQAEVARQNRIKEQKKLEQLKKEAETVALARKKQVEEEKKRLKDLAEEKARETKRLDDLKKQQQKETDRLAELKKKNEDDAKALQKKMEASREMEKNKQKQAEERAMAEANAANQARMSGEIDKYRALILNAISRQWIVPDNVDRSLFSQFRIRLAPDGAVLEVSLVKSSGDPILDRSAQTAIYKASPLPVPQDPTVFSMFRDINLKVRPEYRG